METALSVKRRRAEDATRRLTKPFISPMRTNKQAETSLPPAATPSTFKYIPSSLAHTVQLAYPAVKATASFAKPSARKLPTASATPTRRPTPIWRSTTSFYSSKSKKASTTPEEISIQKAIISLESQIRKTKNDLDTLKQAQQILSSNVDADLEQLTDKWRLASQAIAEDLFGTVKERVCRMGGVAAWREMEKKKHDRIYGIGEFARKEEVVEPDDADCEFDDDGEELPEDEQEYRKKMKRQAEREIMEAADGGEEEVAETQAGGAKEKIWEDEGSDDDSFTMDMMLRSLNIELSVIGYDKVEQRWIV